MRQLRGLLGSARESLEQRLGGSARLRVIVLLASILALNAADQGAVGAVAPQLEANLKISNVELGLLVTVTALVGAVATIPMGNLVDRISRVPLVAWVIIGWGGAEAVSALSFSYPMLIATRVALGAVTAVATPVVASLTGDLFPAGERGRIYGVLITGELIGAGFGVLISGLVAGWFGWRPAIAVLALPSLALWWALLHYLPEPARGGASRILAGDDAIPATREAEGKPEEWQAAHEPENLAKASSSSGEAADTTAVQEAAFRAGAEPEPEIVIDDDPTDWSLWDAVRYVLKVRTNVVIIVASSLGYFFFAGLKTYAVLFVRGHYGVGQSVATLMVIIVGIGAVAGAVLTGRWVDNRIKSGHVTARLDVGVVGYVLAAVLLVPALLTGGLWWAAPLMVVAAAAIAGPSATLDAARLDVVPSQLWGRAEAVRTLVRTTLEAFAPLVFGIVSAEFGGRAGGFAAAAGNGNTVTVKASQVHGLEIAFLIMLVPLAASGICLVWGRKTYPVDVASAACSRDAGAAEPGERLSA